MSFLPYQATSATGWLAAAGGSAVVHSVAIAAVFGAWIHLPGRFDAEEPRQGFTITLETLDTDALIGLTEQQGEAGGDPGAGDADPAAAPDLPPDEVPEALPDSTEPDGPEPPEQALPADATPPAPVAVPDEGPLILQGSDPAQLPGPGGPDTDQSGVVQPLAEPDSERLAMLPPSSPLPAAPGTGQVPDADGAVPRPPSQQDLALGDLIRTIRTSPAAPCLVALPRRDGETGAGVALIGASGQDLRDFSQAALAGAGAGVRQTRTLVDPRQCPALEHVRANGDYPISRLGLRLDSVEVPSGGRLTGVVRGVAGKAVLLMLVDANGVVQDLDRFTTVNGNFARFEVPVTRSGPQRDTAQLLLVLAAPQSVQVLRDRMGRLAQDVFSGIDSTALRNAAIALATFTVR